MNKKKSLIQKEKAGDIIEKFSFQYKSDVIMSTYYIVSLSSLPSPFANISWVPVYISSSLCSVMEHTTWSVCLEKEY